MKPGPASLEGLRWLSRVGPASDDAWAAAMGWSRSTAYRHAARLIAAGWVEQQAMTRGDGRLLFASRDGVAVSQIRAAALAAAPAPTTWAHCRACAWVAAWLTCRGRHIIGARELLADEQWQGQLSWTERGRSRSRGHRPDLIAAMSQEGAAMPVEVELAVKSLARLRSILTLHAGWIASRKATAVVYVCNNARVADHVRKLGHELGVSEERRTLRVELLAAVMNAAVHEAGPQRDPTEESA